jgi:histone H3|tara:strand:- start:1783 stop:2184 length:402 start_codon:yes stop_codon:yes gene_type:complete
MLHIIQQNNEMRYKGTQNKTNMSAAPITKINTLKAPKMSRKQRRAQKEVSTLQEKVTPILPATTFKRIVTQEAANHSQERLRFNTDAVKALQVAAENELTNIFTGASIVASIAKRDTVTVEDMRNFQQLRTIV